MHKFLVLWACRQNVTYFAPPLVRTYVHTGACEDELCSSLSLLLTRELLRDLLPGRPLLRLLSLHVRCHGSMASSHQVFYARYVHVCVDIVMCGVLGMHHGFAPLAAPTTRYANMQTLKELSHASIK